MSEYLQEQLDAVMILQSMYPLPSELVLDSTTSEFISKPTSIPPRHLNLTLTITPEDDPTHTLDIYISLPTSTASSSDKPNNSATITPKQPSWLPRSSYSSLLDLIPQPNQSDTSIDYILTTIEELKHQFLSLVPRSITPSEAESEVEEEGVSLQRVWFWFPSLSSREKRKDLVDYAPTFNLTGFVLAGMFAPFSVASGTD
jgi:hypothetical protein